MSNKQSIDSNEAELISVNLSGKNKSVWQNNKPRLIERILNSIKKFFGSDVRPEFTANKEIHQTTEALIESAKEKIKSPQLINQERTASIRLKIAEAKKEEALARKINLEADQIENEIEREKVHHSQAYIERLIQRGELIPIEKNGALYLVCNETNKK